MDLRDNYCRVEEMRNQNGHGLPTMPPLEYTDFEDGSSSIGGSDDGDMEDNSGLSMDLVDEFLAMVTEGTRNNTILKPCGVVRVGQLQEECTSVQAVAYTCTLSFTLVLMKSGMDRGGSVHDANDGWVMLGYLIYHTDDEPAQGKERK